MPKTGKLFIVGIGPGDLRHLTLAAKEALKEAEVILGYKTYLEQVAPLLSGKETRATGMMEEIKRASLALSLAEEGKVVALVSGGDPGLYGMSAPVFEMLAARGSSPSVPIEIIPGVTAACAAAARLGAPLSNDCAFISLSDRLTPWETIVKRVSAATEADFVLVFYNPKSKRRKDHLARALEEVARLRPEDTPLALVKGAMRPGEKVILTTLAAREEVLKVADMASLVIVGNSQSRIFDGFFLTPRGYGQKYRLSDEEA